MKIKIHFIVALLFAGCAVAPVPVYNPKASNRGSATLARSVIDKQTVTFHEGLQGVILLSSGRLKSMSYNACMAHASKMKIIQGTWAVKYDNKSPLTRGMLAYMLARVLGLRGGVTMRIFDTSPRYALRECQDLKIIEKGSQHSTVSGREFLSILRSAEKYAKENLSGS